MEEAFLSTPSWLSDPCWQSIFLVFVWVFMIGGVAYLLYSAYEKEHK